MKEFLALALYIFIGVIACIAYVAYGAEPPTKPDKPALRQICRFLTCPADAKSISDCPVTVTHDPKAAAKAFASAIGLTGFYDCGGTEGEFQVRKVIFEAERFGGVK